MKWKWLSYFCLLILSQLWLIFSGHKIHKVCETNVHYLLIDTMKSMYWSYSCILLSILSYIYPMSLGNIIQQGGSLFNLTTRNVRLCQLTEQRESNCHIHDLIYAMVFICSWNSHLYDFFTTPYWQYCESPNQT